MRRELCTWIYWHPHLTDIPEMHSGIKCTINIHQEYNIIRKGRECQTCYIPRVICFWRVTRLVAVRKPKGLYKHLVFLRTVKNRGIFHEFYARFFMSTRFILWSARVFGQNRARVRMHSRSRPQCTIWIECSHWSIFEFLARDFPKTSYTEYIVRSILSSPPYYLLLQTCIFLRN